MRTFIAAAEAGEAEVLLSVRVPVCRHNVRDLPDAVAAAVGAGARHVLLQVTDGGLDLPGAMPWVVAACDSGTVNTVWVEASGIPYCVAGTHALHTVPVLGARSGGGKAAPCTACALDGVCEGAIAKAAPDVLAALEPPAGADALAARIREAYLAPRGAGEVE
jgi:hypothetical protein